MNGTAGVAVEGRRSSGNRCRWSVVMVIGVPIRWSGGTGVPGYLFEAASGQRLPLYYCGGIMNAVDVFQVSKQAERTETRSGSDVR